MPSVAASHTSSRSRKSTKHAKSRNEASQELSNTADVPEKLYVKTAGIQRSSSFKTGSPLRPDDPLETLTDILGESRRRSRCPPEFLLEKSSRSLSETYMELGKKFTIVTGSDAMKLYKKFLGGKSAAEILAEKENAAAGNDCAPYLVFAVPYSEGDTGRKFAAYFGTWHGKNVRSLSFYILRCSSIEERIAFLDGQLRKAARALDNEFKRAKVYGPALTASILGSVEDLQESSTIKPQPLTITPPPFDLKLDPPPTPSPSTRPPRSATDSVMSLPFLNMVRGVPLGHHVPLRVTNPDRNSMISSSDGTNTDLATDKDPAHTVLPSIAEDDASPTPAPNQALPLDQELPTPEVARTSRNLSVRSSQSKESTKSSAASTASTESRRKEKEIVELSIVLLEERTEIRTWHGLERQPSKASSRITPSRVSLWDGPLARDSGITYSTPPTRRSSPHKGDDDSSDGEDWEDAPVIPLPVAPSVTRSTSERSHRPVIPGASMRFMMAGKALSATPVVPMVSLVEANTGFGQHSPYIVDHTNGFGQHSPYHHTPELCNAFGQQSPYASPSEVINSFGQHSPYPPHADLNKSLGQPSPYPHSPYLPMSAYTSPYHSPIIPPTVRPLSRNIYPGGAPFHP
ncbi:hypothetical protein H0H81_008819 [Sphagnurus paluster]|uniref:Uncharacterized protein n=1 Tax=Sphagnurus paluster TaxID=117069 RepID=A0A9P7K764_9AGAR|nr:hypothetical protein H0H81_008819 [Sphagnurus paluster]